MNPGNPSMPHTSDSLNGAWHVDLNTGIGDKLHIPVQNLPAAQVIGQAYRDQLRQDLGRG